jgi:hypothetical protein
MKMNKHRTHQIDDLAQQILHAALPPSWVPNEQHRDYGKDYIVEIGEENGDLTGSSFYVQLKGQETVDLCADGSLVKYSLESKYATYYFDKIKDLPVFLIVVDVNKKKGWWLFLQPVLEADQTWRKQNSITVRLPESNNITNTASVRKAVEDAKKWMRLHHPESIHEAVVAHKERIVGTDPRFGVSVSLVNDKPIFTLLPKKKVSLKFSFNGERGEIARKVSDLVDKGVLVAFQPGEVKVAGSKLFDPIEQGGCAIQATVNLTVTFTVICQDEEGTALARLSDVPGMLSGGRKELWLDGGWVNSPLSLKLGPIAPSTGGSVQLSLDLHRWDGQLLNHLAYFDRLNEFFQTLPKSASASIECQRDGNVFFSATLPLQSQPFAVPLAGYLETLSKARKIAQRFSVNPTWTVEAFDENTQENADRLYAILFGTGWSEPMPNVRLTASCIRETFRFEVATRAEKAGFVRLTSECTYTFFGKNIEVGKLVHEYTEMSIKVSKERAVTATRKRKKDRVKKKRVITPTRQDTVEIVLVGSEATIMRVWVDKGSSSKNEAEAFVLSSQSKVAQP